MPQSGRAIGIEHAPQEEVISGDAQQAETGDQNARHRAGAERDIQSGLKSPGPRRIGGTDIAPNRDVHPDIPGHTRQDGADEIADGDIPVERHAKNYANDHADAGNGCVLPVKIGAGAFLNGEGDLRHPLIPGARAKNGAGGECAVNKGDQPARNHEPVYCCHRIWSLFCSESFLNACPVPIPDR